MIELILMLSIVTWNTWKFKQISEALPDFLETQQVALDIPEIQTNLLTEISADKCLQAFKEIWWPVLVDDSWIYFDAFNQFPGALSKFLYEWVGIAWMQRMYEWVENKKAVFECVLSYMDETLNAPLQFIGQVPWIVTFDYIDQWKEDPKLAYDIIFQLDGMDEPALFNMAEWKKNNHRTRAVKKFNEWLMENESK